MLITSAHSPGDYSATPNAISFGSSFVELPSSINFAVALSEQAFEMRRVAVTIPLNAYFAERIRLGQHAAFYDAAMVEAIRVNDSLAPCGLHRIDVFVSEGEKLRDISPAMVPMFVR